MDQLRERSYENVLSFPLFHSSHAANHEAIVRKAQRSPKSTAVKGHYSCDFALPAGIGDHEDAFAREGYDL
jgi:hypothetical protein